VFESFLNNWSRLPVKSLGLQIGLSKRCALDITAGYGVSSSAAVRRVAVSETVGEDERACRLLPRRRKPSAILTAMDTAARRICSDSR
jgi:hypothetical protein